MVSWDEEETLTHVRLKIWRNTVQAIRVSHVLNDCVYDIDTGRGNRKFRIKEAEPSEPRAGMKDLPSEVNSPTFLPCISVLYVIPILP